MTKNLDAVWKSVAETLVEEMIHYFYPDKIDRLDLTKIVFPPKDLFARTGTGAAEIHTRSVDVLIKIPYRDSEEFELLHLEFEDDQRINAFPQRMFEYAIQLYLRFGQVAGSLAIFIGRKKHVPWKYRDKSPLARLYFKYTGLSVIGLCIRELLEKEGGPFIAVLWGWQTYLYATKTNAAFTIREYNDIINYIRTLGLVSSKQIAVDEFLLCCISGLAPLDPGKFGKLKDKIINKSINKSDMEKLGVGMANAVLESWKKEAIDEGREQGIEQGIAQGIEQEREAAKARWKALLKSGMHSAEELSELFKMPLDAFSGIQKEIDTEASA